MSRGIGLLLVLAGSALLLDDSLGREAPRGSGLDVLLLLMGSSLLVGEGEEGHA
jgi:hypothetical protein